MEKNGSHPKHTDDPVFEEEEEEDKKEMLNQSLI